VAGEKLDNQILDVATRMFLQYGYKHTTVDLIVSQVGIAKGSFYLHYASKNAVFAAVSGRVAGEVLAKMERIADSDMDVEAKLHESIRGSILYIWDFCHQAPHAPTLWMELLEAAVANMVPAQDQGQKILARIIRQGQSEGLFASGIDADAEARMIQLATEGFGVPFRLIDSRQKIENELPLLIDLLIRGLKHGAQSVKSSSLEGIPRE
jgi:AcrR family transcriptional regulator